jgi:polynucleotide 5'-hydroxyl-kinase GRC3/NOL9
VQPDVPLDWAAAVRRVLDGNIRGVLVLGGVDADKSSFCRLLRRNAAEAGRAVELLDADLGQKLAGPPGCVTLVHRLATAPAALAFVGALDPLRGWRRGPRGWRPRRRGRPCWWSTPAA